MNSFWARKFAICGLLGGLMGMAGCTGGKGLKWAESKAPSVRVNQVGYLTAGPQWATVRTTATAPLPARLLNGERVVWQGQSAPKGVDEASGDSVHQVDFSSFREDGTNLILKVGDGQSFPFDVRQDVYAQLPLDALKYFYHNRSGVPIVRPYIDDQNLSRPAGHLSDKSVPCWVQEDCTYSLDVSGGWYDAGDHGKYVVNGGISAWTLLTLFERLHHLSKSSSRWGDGTLNIPESGNGAPDLLDEARFEVEFLLKMQIPEGQPLAGLAHHKIHDDDWTPLGMEPPQEADNRALHPPSTAATLNLAAVAAQASRLWQALDPPFSRRCLLAAEKAYEAALRHPNRYASDLDKNGGGPYSDQHVEDEFFWAEAELFITTGRVKYLEKLQRSDHFKSFPTRLIHEDGSVDGDGVTGSMTWQPVAALGWISLAIVPSKLPNGEVVRLRDSVIHAADAYLRVIEHEGYRQPLGLGTDKKYPWGSNSFILNNMVVLTCIRLHEESQVRWRCRSRDGLHPRPEPDGPKLRHGLRERSPRTASSPFLGEREGPSVSETATRSRVRRPQLQPSRPANQALRARSVPAPAKMLRRPHRRVERERDHDQLERPTRVERYLPRRVARPSDAMIACAACDSV